MSENELEPVVAPSWSDLFLGHNYEMTRLENHFVLRCQELSYEDLSREMLEKITRNLTIPCELIMGQDSYSVFWYNGSLMLD